MPHRFDSNPIISPKDVRPFRDDFEVIGVFNPGVTVFDNKVLLLLRIAVRPKQTEKYVTVPYYQDGAIDVLQFDKEKCDTSDSRVVIFEGKRYLTSMSYLLVATSADGKRFDIDYSKTIFPSEMLEEYGIEDARITKIDNAYYVTYSAISHCGICTMLKRTTDFCSYERLGMIMHPDNKDVALFPSAIGDKYYLLHRPSTSEFGRPEIWLAQSPDLIHWGNHQYVAGVRVGKWDGLRMGASGIPHLTEKGWLLIYHGADASNRYCLGAMLLDRDDPQKVLARTERPLLEPELPYETDGFFSNVVFACGGVFYDDHLDVYYGAADCCICGVTLDLSEIFAQLENN